MEGGEGLVINYGEEGSIKIGKSRGESFWGDMPRECNH